MLVSEDCILSQIKILSEFMHAYDLMSLLGTATVQLALILFIDDNIWLSGLLIFIHKKD